MSNETFSRREVERSFRKFKDCVNDLFAAVFQTWGDCFTHLMTHCEVDHVMRVVTEPLRSNTSVNAREWYQNAANSTRGMVGSGRYTLPTDDDDRTALLYQFFLMLENNEVDLLRFCNTVYGTSRHQDSVNTFNRELVSKFTREVSYRLDEIIQDLGDATEVRREAMLVFHYHDNKGQDHSMNFHGPVQGANVAGPGATITGSTATYNNNTDLAAALKALKPLIAEVASEQRQAVESALHQLVEATHKDIPVAQVAPALETVAKASPTLAQRLKDIGSKIGLSLMASSIFQAIKSYFGIH
jgi:hypothetical protein